MIEDKFHWSYEDAKLMPSSDIDFQDIQGYVQLHRMSANDSMEHESDKIHEEKQEKIARDYQVLI